MRSGMNHTVSPANYTMSAFTVSAFTRWRLHRLRLQTSNCSLLLIYLPWKDERLSWPGWLTYSGQFTHTSGHPSVVGRAQDRKGLLVKDQRSTTVPRNQPYACSTYILPHITWLQTLALQNYASDFYISGSVTTGQHSTVMISLRTRYLVHPPVYVTFLLSSV